MSTPPPGSGPVTAEARLGHVLAGRYRIESLLGSGGVGVVYRAVDLEAERAVALKVLTAAVDLTGQTLSRFRREGDALSRLAHAHVVEVLDSGIDGGVAFIAMELLEGRTLSQLIDSRGALDVQTALDVARQILSALAFAHGERLVHRDLKPANIFLTGPETAPTVKLLDFGLVKFLDPEQSAVDQTLTRSGMVLGTPLYMAPEQCTGDRIDARADVYAAGCVLYEMLSGEPPYVRDSHADVVRAHLVDELPRLPAAAIEPGLASQLQALVDRAMAKRPEDRFDDAGQMLVALDAVRAGLEVPARPRRPRSARGGATGWASRAALALALVAGGAFVFYRFGLDHDPWKARGVPPELGAIRAKVLAGDGIDRDEQRALRVFARAHPEDPRAYLLLGHAFMNQGWRKDAIARYREAFEADSAARLDPRVLPALLELTQSDAHGDEACDAIATLYGDEALPEVEARLATLTDATAEHRRLSLLRTRLTPP